MTEIDRILKHYDGVLSGDAWHGDSVWKVLGDIPAETAAARPVSSAHSIWEIVAHMTFWEGVVIHRLHGKRAGLIEELNFPRHQRPPRRTGVRLSKSSATLTAHSGRRSPNLILRSSTI